MTCRIISPYNSIELIVESYSTLSLSQIPALSCARNFQATMNSALLEYPKGIEQRSTYFYTDQMGWFEYIPLEEDIRMLELAPGTGDNPIQGILSHETLKPARVYEAISYVPTKVGPCAELKSTRIRPVFLAEHLLQHVPESVWRLLLPLPLPCMRLAQ